MKTLPHVHLNGTSAKDLFKGYRRAYEACRDALHVIEEIEFNARDYYPIHPHAWAEARAEMGRHVMHICEAKHAFLTVCSHIQEVAGHKLDDDNGSSGAEQRPAKSASMAGYANALWSKYKQGKITLAGMASEVASGTTDAAAFVSIALVAMMSKEEAKEFKWAFGKRMDA